MSKYTPGPWTVFNEGGIDTYPGIEAGKQSIIVFGDDSEPNDWCGVCGETTEQALANARLVAAAPTLLSELEDAVAFMKERMAQDGDHGVSILIRHAEAAIKLATGETK